MRFQDLCTLWFSDALSRMVRVRPCTVHSACVRYVLAVCDACAVCACDVRCVCAVCACDVRCICTMHMCDICDACAVMCVRCETHIWDVCV